MLDGYLGKCKDCTKSDTKQRQKELSKDPLWVEKEKTRSREKYYRLEYREKHKPTYEMKKEAARRYKSKYPEKYLAISKSSKMKAVIKGNHLHHWSYNEKHYKDVIELTIIEHNRAHRYMTYNDEFKMYSADLDNDILLDTKEKHIKYLNKLKKGLV
tara:strand:+ start:133 stop:603 length:471 start_codon:yes stop_codon:yes gene_type:complete